MAELKHHPITVAIRDLQSDRFRGAQPSSVVSGQCGMHLQGSDRLEELHDLVSDKIGRQLAGRATVGDPLGGFRTVQGNTVEKSLGADRLVECWSGKNM